MKRIFKQPIARANATIDRRASIIRTSLLVATRIAPAFVVIGFAGLASAQSGVVQRSSTPDVVVLTDKGATAAKPGKTQRLTNVAPGAVNEKSTDAVNGSQLNDTNQAVNAVADYAASSVQYERNKDGTLKNSIKLEGGDPNAPVVVSNVAAGQKDTDAANVGQVADALKSSYDYTYQVAKDANAYTTYVANYATSYTDARAAETLSAANAYTDQRFDKLSSEIHGVRGEARQAAAIGLAASSLRYDDRPGKISAAIGGGVWRGEGAGAFGLGYTSEDQLIRANISATTAGGQWGVGAGLSYTFN